MAKNKVFTAKFIEALKHTDEEQALPDPGLSGFYIVLQPAPSTTQTWVVRYRFNGKPKKYTLGAVAKWDLGDAREEAKRILRLVSQGEDPQGLKMAGKTDTSTLFENVVADFAKQHMAVHNKESTRRENQRIIDNKLLPKWTGKKIEAISREEISNLITGIALNDGPQAGLRTHALLSKFFSWCIGSGRLKGQNLFTGIPRPAKATARERTLTHDEVRLVWKAAEVIDWPFGPMVQLLMLLGQRRDEVAAAEWKEFDFRAEPPRWMIPGSRTKNGKKHLIVLPPAAVAIIKALPRVGVRPRYLLSTTGESPVSGYSRGKRRLDAAMLKIAKEEALAAGGDPEHVEIESFTLHDLRRTFETMALDDLDDPVVSPHAIDAVLNHAKKGLEKHYNHSKMERAKATVLSLWAAHVEKIVGLKPGAEIIEFSKKMQSA